MTTLDYLMSTLAQVKATAESAASYRWATVTNVSPLQILFDGDQTPILREPTNLVGPLEKGQRVWVLTVLRRSTIVGRAGGAGLPTGALLPYTGAKPPRGFLLCDGASYAKSLYPALAAVLGATGTGTSFQVPDMRERGVLGSSQAYPLGSVGGEATHVLTLEEMPRHTHKIVGTEGRWSTGAGIYSTNVGSGSGWEGLSNWTPGSPYLAATNAGESKAHNNLPPYRAVNWIIKT